MWWFTECTIPYDRPSNISGNDGENIFSFLRLIVILQVLVKLGRSLLGSKTMIPKSGWKTVESGGKI